MHRAQIKYISFPHINYIKYQSRAMHKRHILIIISLYNPEINKVFNKNNTLKQTLIFNPIYIFSMNSPILVQNSEGVLLKMTNAKCTKCEWYTVHKYGINPQLKCSDKNDIISNLGFPRLVKNHQMVLKLADILNRKWQMFNSVCTSR